MRGLRGGVGRDLDHDFHRCSRGRLLDVLRTIQRERGGDLGIGALVTGEGAIAVGDEVFVRRLAG